MHISETPAGNLVSLSRHLAQIDPIGPAFTAPLFEDLISYSLSHIAFLRFRAGLVSDADPSRRSRRLAGLLHPAERHAPAAPAGGARGGDPGGDADGGQGAERLHPGVGAEGQTHRAGGETDPRGR